MSNKSFDLKLGVHNISNNSILFHILSGMWRVQSAEAGILETAE